VFLAITQKLVCVAFAQLSLVVEYEELYCSDKAGGDSTMFPAWLHILEPDGGESESSSEAAWSGRVNAIVKGVNVESHVNKLEAKLEAKVEEIIEKKIGRLKEDIEKTIVDSLKESLDAVLNNARGVQSTAQSASPTGSAESVDGAPDGALDRDDSIGETPPPWPSPAPSPAPVDAPVLAVLSNPGAAPIEGLSKATDVLGRRVHPRQRPGTTVTRRG
jgi:hypothetical protein